MNLQSFQDRKGRFKKGTHWRPHSIFRERAYLLVEYVEKCRSAGEIAVEHGVTDEAIIHWLRKHKITRRNTSESRKVKHWGVSGPANPMYGMRGPLSPNYKGGITPERQKLYSQVEWKTLVANVRSRDSFKCCRCCGTTQLLTHHRKSWTKHPEARVNMDNLVTLCKTCHAWVHRPANFPNDWRE